MITLIPLLTVLGTLSMLTALGVWLGERNDFDPNNGLAIFLLLVGAFMVLLAAILRAGLARGSAHGS